MKNKADTQKIQAENCHIPFILTIATVAVPVLFGRGKKTESTQEKTTQPERKKPKSLEVAKYEVSESGLKFFDAKGFPKEIRAKATSLKRETGRPVSRRAFVSLLLEELERWYEIFLKEGGSSLLEAWKARAQIEGKRVRVTSFGEVLTGRAVDIDSNGALILTTGDGERIRVVAGDIEYEEKSEIRRPKS